MFFNGLPEAQFAASRPDLPRFDQRTTTVLLQLQSLSLPSAQPPVLKITWSVLKGYETSLLYLTLEMAT